MVTMSHLMALIRGVVVARVNRVVVAVVLETGEGDGKITTNSSSSHSTHQPLHHGEAVTGAGKGGTGGDTGIILTPGSEVVTAGDTSACSYRGMTYNSDKRDYKTTTTVTRTNIVLSLPVND